MHIKRPRYYGHFDKFHSSNSSISKKDWERIFGKPEKKAPLGRARKTARKSNER